MPAFKILLDECVDQRLALDIPHHWVKTVAEMGWAGLKNGKLLSKAQKEFDIFLTTDRNLSFQQNLVDYNIAILVLCPVSARLPDLQEILPKAIRRFSSLHKGKAIFIYASDR